MATFSYAQIYRVISRIPRGRVATYGQVARLAGIPNGARSVGYALSALDETSTVPWHRVVNAAGETSCRARDNGLEDLQRIRLEQEGVQFDAQGRLPLSQVRWDPEA